MSALCAALWVVLGWAEFWAWQPFVCVGNGSDHAVPGGSCTGLGWGRSAWLYGGSSLDLSSHWGSSLFLCNGMAVPWELLDMSTLNQREKEHPQ